MVHSDTAIWINQQAMLQRTIYLVDESQYTVSSKWGKTGNTDNKMITETGL